MFPVLSGFHGSPFVVDWNRLISSGAHDGFLFRCRMRTIDQEQTTRDLIVRSGVSSVLQEILLLQGIL